MTSVKRTQLVLLAVAAVLSVLLYIAPKQPQHAPVKEAALPGKARAAESIESFVKTAVAVLAPAQKQQHDRFLKNAAGAGKTQWLDSLTAFWDQLKRPDIASFYVEKKAADQNKAAEWFKAGDRYYYSLRFVKDNNEMPTLYQNAMHCYENGLKLEPGNTDARIMLAACYVEGTQDPMKGIGMLKEVEKTDSNNVKLQMNFAMFSVRSQQWDKAIARFNKVLAIDPTYIEAWLHLADAYEQRGDKNKTIEMLEKYVAATNDPTSKQEVKRYIQQLKNTN